MSNRFNASKVNNSTHVQMLIVQNMQKNALTHFNVNKIHQVVVHVSIHNNKCNMQHLSNGFNRFKVDDSTCTYMLIV
jgi:hypothetical protein